MVRMLPSRGRTRWPVALLALCFFARTAFYAIAYPVWEGYDEWSHYAVIERVALRHEALPSRDHAVSQRVAASLRLAPLPWQLKQTPPPAVPQDAYWHLPPGERAARERAFAALPAQPLQESPGEYFRAYEALQPPLYYWLMAPLLRLLSGASLGTSVIALRLAGCILAAFTIPLVYRLARETLGSHAAALGCAAVVALMPEFAIDVARVGNEAVAVPLFTALTLLAVQGYRSGFGLARSAALGVVLGCGLLAKAYFLTALPAIAIVLFLAYRRHGPALPETLRNAAVLILAAGGIGGWWYVRNVVDTGTVAGLAESVLVRSLSVRDFLVRALQADYRAGIDATLFSHLWFGGWSALTVRSWMYHVFYAVILLAGIGLLRQRLRGLVPLAALYFAFWAGLVYNIALLFVSKGASTCMGWYLYAAVGAEVVLCWAGLQGLAPRRPAAWIPALGATLFGLLDLYTVHAVSLPYYTGMIAHRANGSLAALHGAGWAQVGLTGMIVRLGGFKGVWGAPAVLVTAWALYLAGTLLPIGLALHSARNNGARALVES